ncbi:hypothetical protein HY745_01080 [Candidatus Desantisbacteria bacterium]|nr:hypothetical protein [Candidatus Desantisbacteria bacterium]
MKIINISINIFISLIILSLIASADEISNPDIQSEKISRNEMSGYLEAGKRSTALDYVEEDSDADYSYTNYQFRFKQNIASRFSYDLSSFQYKKDYDGSDVLDNESKIFKAGGSYYINKQKEKSLKFDMKFQYKEKNYYNIPEKEYNQLTALPSLKFKKEDFYAVSLSIGLNRYDYITGDKNDQFKYSSKLDFYRYFIEKKFMLSGYEEVEFLDNKQTDRDRVKNNLMLGLMNITNMILRLSIN